MKLEIGDDVECKARPEIGVGKVCFMWLTGNIDVNYPDGKKLINWPQEDFEVLPKAIDPTESAQAVSAPELLERSEQA